jgi:hypothetical protein
MHPDKLLKYANIFYTLATAKGVDAILKKLQELDTYTARKDYAEDNLEHLSSGSARIVYLTPSKTVVKLAKNDRGIAQNRAESNPDMTSPFLNKTIRHADNYVWMETHYLEKITGKEFEEMTGISFADFDEAIRFGLKNVSENTGLKKPKNFDQVAKSEIYKEMKRVGEKFRLLPGDIARASSWGAKDGHPVLIDAGLTSAIFDKYYDDTSSSSKS